MVPTLDGKEKTYLSSPKPPLHSTNAKHFDVSFEVMSLLETSRALSMPSEGWGGGSSNAEQKNCVIQDENRDVLEFSCKHRDSKAKLLGYNLDLFRMLMCIHSHFLRRPLLAYPDPYFCFHHKDCEVRCLNQFPARKPTCHLV